ncbi:MAG: hypothetical protein GX616_02220, partial [Planctomycetes bacterium]|nr:hypothetical protein [Planctomycetota bacterium]
TRRTFLGSAALAGAAATLPNWLGGCGIFPADGPAMATEREERDLHFDLSGLDPHAEYTLHVIGSSADGAVLNPHTDESWENACENNILLGQIVSGQLTHYVNEVDFPADAVQQWWVTATTAEGETVVAMHVHIPQTAYGNLVEARRRGVMAGRSAKLVDEQSHAKLRHLNIAKLSKAPNAKVLADLNSINTPLDAAVSIVFHHPEIMSLDPDQAALIVDIIENLKGDGASCTGGNVGLLTALACRISAQGLPGVDKGWLRKRTATDLEGRPVLDSNGQPIIEYDPSDETLEAAEPVIKKVLKEVFNHPDLKGDRGGKYPGVAVVDGQAPAENAHGTDSGYAFDLECGDKSDNLYGLLFKKFSVSGQERRVSFDVYNVYVRHVACQVLFFLADGETPVSDDYSAGVHDLSPNDHIMGIPMLHDWSRPRTHFDFKIPPSASIVKLKFGTLGIGAPPKAMFVPGLVDSGYLIKRGAASTLGLDIGVPSALLAIGIGLRDSEIVKQLGSDPKVIAFLAGLFVGAEIGNGLNQGSAREPLIHTGKAMVFLMLSTPLSGKLCEHIFKKKLEDACPFAGLAMRVMSIAASVSVLAQTVGEVLSSPAAFEATISTTMNTTVTISHDPNNFAFPAVAKRYVIRATYDNVACRQICGTLPTTRSDPITITLQNVPVGGNVRIDVWFLSDSNWIAGYAGTGGWVESTDPAGQKTDVFVHQSVPNFPAEAGTFAFQLKEFLVPIDPNTIYSHKQKLAFDANTRKHYWLASERPAATAGTLDPGKPDRLHALNGITVSQTAGMAAYSWRTGAPATGVCPGDSPAATSLNLLQNISLTQRPDDALKLPDCGRMQVAAVAYSLLAPLKCPDRNFYVDPVYGPHKIDAYTSLPYKYHVRSVSVDSMTDTTPWDASAGRSWGFFSQCPDAIAVHPRGKVIAINRANSKMEILDISEELPDEEASVATCRSGEGSVSGLMYQPVAMGISPEGAILVLEAGNNRIQAFDCIGNVTNVFLDFENKPTNE